MTEAAFWRSTVKPYLSPFGVMHRVENTVESGTPDVTYTLRHPDDRRATSGWIELKHTSIPVRNKTQVRFKRFTVEQAEWLREWSAAGGRAWLLVAIGPAFALVEGSHCPSIQEGIPLGDFRDVSEVWGDNRFPAGRVLRCLTR